jgi:putative toxin-antitoxin system antitoxin component (TIGR02293 family)
MATQTHVFSPSRPSRRRVAASDTVPGNALFRRLGLGREPTELLRQVREGFHVAVIEKLAGELDVPQSTLLRVAGIAPATLSRRRKSPAGLLSPEESDRVYRIAATYRASVQLFEGDEAAARAWLSEPARALGGATPLEHLDTEAGAGAVRELIGRLEHGVYT